MTPKEKAEELVNKYWDSLYEVSGDIEYIGTQSKQCALIAVDEIIKEVTPKVSIYTYQLQFWQEVKNEINLL